MRITTGMWFRPGMIGTCLLFGLLALTGGVFAQHQIELQPIGTYETGIFDDAAAEIVVHDPATQRLFVVNGSDKAIDVLSIADPTNPVKLFAIDVSAYGDQPNSVAIYDGLVAAAVENDDKQAPGVVVFFDVDGQYINHVTAGALPDMVTFTPNGKAVLVANEGEPNDDYDDDPEGSVSIIPVYKGVASLTDADVAHATFDAYNFSNIDPAVRIFGPAASVAQDLEPEYIAISRDSKTAYVSLQENNALAIIDIRSATVTAIVPFGYKDHSVPANALDASNRDDAINIANWPALGMYQPDAIVYFKRRGKGFLLTANEGDARDYDGYSEEERVKDLTLDPVAFPNAGDLQEDENLGRLNSTLATGDTDGDGDFDEIYAYGARSFSVWDTDGQLLYDSGDELEQITALLDPANFNSTNDENDTFDNRSDDKGPEPEGIVLGKVDGRYYAFIGLERIGGIMVYDISYPYQPEFVQYINTRNFDGDPEDGTAGDLAPEGLAFVHADDSPTGKPLLVVAYEVSGSTTVFEINCASGGYKSAGGGESLETTVETFNLAQNFPNPFNPETEIRFSIEKDGAVQLTIYNNLGQKIRTLFNGSYSAGSHSVVWDGRDDVGQQVSSGMYFYRLNAGGKVAIRRMTLSR